jgi:hypothetical protein
LQNAATLTDYIVPHKAIAVTTKLVDAIYVAGFIVHISGFRQLIRINAPRNDAWIADLVFGAGLVHAAIVLAGRYSPAEPPSTPSALLTNGSEGPYRSVCGGVRCDWLLEDRAIPCCNELRHPQGTHGATGRMGGLATSSRRSMSPQCQTIYKGNDFLATVIISGGNTASGLYAFISAITGLI